MLAGGCRPAGSNLTHPPPSKETLCDTGARHSTFLLNCTNATEVFKDHHASTIKIKAPDTQGISQDGCTWMRNPSSTWEVWLSNESCSSEIQLDHVSCCSSSEVAYCCQYSPHLVGGLPTTLDDPPRNGQPLSIGQQPQLRFGGSGHTCTTSSKG